jgi:uncharacterized metal-binding protein YceD (DUF177 family)
MHVLKEYNVVFSGLSLGEHNYDYVINRSFFDSFGYTDFEEIQLKVHVTLEKQDSLISIHFNILGEIEVNCDRCGNELTKSVQTSNTLLLKFSDHTTNDGDDLITLPNTAFEINLSQYIYEYTSLAIPTRRVHEGDCLSDLIKETTEEEKEADQESIDPRWKALEQLKKNSKL